MKILRKQKRLAGFLSRLRRDEAGNAIAIVAASMIPAIGIIGGAVDMSRVFIVRTNMQAACDAGALMGRRVMGSGTWTADNNLAKRRAEKLFDTNFGDGSYATENLVRSFSESNGKVTGVATVDVPMALMTVFGAEDKTITVTCDAEMRLPASDIMFVFDTTGSMNCPDDGSACPNGNNNNVEAANAKIKGLRRASACFYEALMKQNIAAYSAADCGEDADPQGATSDTRIRFGFVPYSVNVNVGRLLPLDYMANQWTYQSREPVFTTTTTTNYTPTYGSEGTITYNSDSSQDTPFNNNWTNMNQNLVHSNGSTYSYFYTNNGNVNCQTVPDQTVSTPLTAPTFWYQTPNPVTYPTSTVTKYYRATEQTARYMYMYNKSTVTTGSGRNRVTTTRCQLQYKLNQLRTRTIVYTTSTPVTWTGTTTTNTAFSKWIYRPVTYNVSALKNTAGNSWNSSLALNLGDNGTSKSISWNGCIEERQTARVTDNDPSDNWDTIPDDALDMQIEMAPTSSNNTKWGPLLGGVMYRKYKWDGDSWEYTLDAYETAENRTYYPDGTYVSHNGSFYTSTNVDEYCPTAAKLYSEMNGTDFSSYLNSLVTGGNTYHDIGLLWGARLMAPNGIFSSVTSDRSEWVERHMIFMTDGDTAVGTADYAAHGMHWWDRRQNNGTSAPSSDWLKANVDARTQAICDWVRNENITLWVVAFGQGISSDTVTKLQSCATTGRYFAATDTAALIDDFKEIAETISALRLTN